MKTKNDVCAVKEEERLEGYGNLRNSSLKNIG